ncbi:TonB-dependent receptor [Segetibacter sp.]|jgi:TonB-linked SusC/RagA family outer membrane protein|uniref:SusC/RagA family TonB-linked outer membrane protein n=1 Tax=Segetibacter sp. TaxID=2231182 RepID=UPI00261B108B|nr:TonB-dependent receptor [Segetibacter sp.]MCW3080481.1 TonB-dependent receptor plug [Segetibacter sp.]
MPKHLTARSLLLTACLLFFSTFTFAQRTVSGKVTGPNNEPISGATVTVKGTSIATQTNAEGTFTLSAPNDGGTLVITNVGFENTEVSAAGRGLLDVTMRPSNATLTEVVVTGYTTQAKRDITGSVAVVNVKELIANPGSNVQSLLQGRAAGVTVGTSGVPGTGANVRIHGYSTFGNNEPLYVVDGARVGAITELNPNDIESLQVLKDASAASIYGSAAAGGVIIITTKKGKLGRAKVTYDAYYGNQTFNKRLDLLNTAEYGQYLYLLALNSGNVVNGQFKHGQYAGPTGISTTGPIIPDFIYAGGGQPGGKSGGIAAGDAAADPAKYKLDLFDVNGPGTYQIVPANKQGTDWLGAILQKAPQMNHQVSVSGGTDNANYLFGLDYFDQKGIIYTTRYQRIALRSNTSFVIKNKIRVGENLQVNFTNRSGVQGFTNQDEGNPISFSYRQQPIVPVFDIAGNYGGARGANLGNSSNPYANLDRRKDAREKRLGLIGSIYAEVDFLRYFTFKTNLGVDFGNTSSFIFTPPIYENPEGRTNIAQFSEAQGYGYQATWYNTLNFRKSFNDVHEVKALLGTEIVQNQGRNINASASDFFSLDPNFQQVASTLSLTPSGSSSLFRSRKYSPVIAQVNYAFKDRYLLSASYRRDGSSDAFGPNNKYGDFPAFSVGWRVSEEGFFKNIKGINDFKIRFGYGVLGNDNITSFAYLNFFRTANDAGYPVNGSNTSYTPALRHQTIANPDIKWEQTKTATLGFDATLLNNKLAVTVDLYNRETTDLLFEKELDASIYGGFISRQPINIGNMNNKGIDLSLSYRGNSGKDFRYDVSTTFSLYKNRVGKLADPFFEGDRTRIDPFNRSVTGQPISSFYGYVIDGFFDDAAELATLTQAGKFIGGWKYKDLSGIDGKPDGKITPEDRTFIGSPHPKFVMGFNVNMSFKGFDFATFLYWKAGGEIANYTRYWTDFNTFQGGRTRRLLYESWTPENKDAKLPRITSNDASSGTLPVNYYIEPGGYLRLRNLSLGYTLPKKIMDRFSIDRLRVYVQVQNLFTITKYTGLDPEITTANTGRNDYTRRNADRNLGVDLGNYPTNKSVIFGINLGF